MPIEFQCGPIIFEIFSKIWIGRSINSEYYIRIETYFNSKQLEHGRMIHAEYIKSR